MIIINFLSEINLWIGDEKSTSEMGGVGVEKELFLLLQSMVRSNNDVMQGNKDLMLNVLESSRRTKGQGSAEEEEAENTSDGKNSQHIDSADTSPLIMHIYADVFVLAYMHL